MKNCAWCDTKFESNISYQIYCSSNCRDAATKEKIAIRYEITRRQKRIGKKRSCKSCGQSLSIYNDDILCNLCNINPKQVNKGIKDIKRIINGRD